LKMNKSTEYFIYFLLLVYDNAANRQSFHKVPVNIRHKEMLFHLPLGSTKEMRLTLLGISKFVRGPKDCRQLLNGFVKNWMEKNGMGKAR